MSEGVRVCEGECMREGERGCVGCAHEGGSVKGVRM